MSEQTVFDALKYRVEIDCHGNRRYYNSTGILHRDGEPAVVHTNGHKEWWQNGQRHRVDGPAVECTCGGGGKYRYQNGLLHREDGSAIERNDGTKAWFINGCLMTETEFNQAVNYHE